MIKKEVIFKAPMSERAPGEILIGELKIEDQESARKFYETLITILSLQVFSRDGISIIAKEDLEYVNSLPLFIQQSESKYWIVLSSKEIEIAFNSAIEICKTFGLNLLDYDSENSYIFSLPIRKFAEIISFAKYGITNS